MNNMKYKTSEAQRKAQKKYAEKHRNYYNTKQKEYAKKLRTYKHRIDLALKYIDEYWYWDGTGINELEKILKGDSNENI